MTPKIVHLCIGYFYDDTVSRLQVRFFTHSIMQFFIHSFVYFWRLWNSKIQLICNWLVCIYNSTCASLKLFVALMHDHIVTVMHGLLSVFMVL